MKYVKLTVKPDTWYVEGTEVWSEDTDVRLTVEEYEKWIDTDAYPEHKGPPFIICVVGIRKLDNNFPYEREYKEKHGVDFRIDGEMCSGTEFDVEFVDDDGTENILNLLEEYNL